MNQINRRYCPFKVGQGPLGGRLHGLLYARQAYHPSYALYLGQFLGQPIDLPECLSLKNTLGLSNHQYDLFTTKLFLECAVLCGLRQILDDEIIN